MTNNNRESYFFFMPAAAARAAAAPPRRLLPRYSSKYLLLAAGTVVRVGLFIWYAVSLRWSVYIPLTLLRFACRFVVCCFRRRSGFAAPHAELLTHAQHPSGCLHECMLLLLLLVACCFGHTPHRCSALSLPHAPLWLACLGRLAGWRSLGSSGRCPWTPPRVIMVTVAGSVAGAMSRAPWRGVFHGDRRSTTGADVSERSWFTKIYGYGHGATVYV